MQIADSDAAFLVADARRAGKPRRWIDGADFERPYRGVRAPKVGPTGDHPAAERRTAAVRACLRFAVHMHSAEYFSHTTAALLWGLPLPVLPDAEPHVSVPGRAPRLKGIHGHQIDPSLSRVVRHPILGLPLTDPATTWAMCCSIHTISSPSATPSYGPSGSPARKLGSNATRGGRSAIFRRRWTQVGAGVRPRSGWRCPSSARESPHGWRRGCVW
jgi:hypothetical protein